MPSSTKCGVRLTDVLWTWKFVAHVLVSEQLERRLHHRRSGQIRLNHHRQSEHQGTPVESKPSSTWSRSGFGLGAGLGVDGVIRAVRSKAGSTSGGRKVLERWSARVVETKPVQGDLATGSRGDHQAAFATTQPCHQHTGSPVGAKLVIGRIGMGTDKPKSAQKVVPNNSQSHKDENLYSAWSRGPQ